MKIFSISRIKDEMDIIESFIRYNLNIVDGMIILDNNSTDKTEEILRLLEKEYDNIYIYKNMFNEHHDIVLEINYLLNIAVEEYDADIIIPLDADEFITTDTNNPRVELEKLENSNDTYYRYNWKTYLPIYDEFNLHNLRYIRSNKLEDHEKIIIPSNLVKNFDIKINPGSHSISCEDNINKVLLDNIKLAHVPIRSSSQCVSKICNGWLNNRSRILYNTKNSWHQKLIFDKIIENNGCLSDDELVDIALSFSSKISFDNRNDVIEEDIFNLNFCENIEIKYTHDQINEYSNILKNMEELSYNYSKLSDIHKNMISDVYVLNEKYDLHKYVNGLELHYSKLKYELENRADINQQEVNKLHTHIKNLQNKIKLYDKTIQEKNRKIKEYDNAIKQKNDKVALYQNTINQKNDKINAYIKTVEKRERVIENLEEKIRQKDEEINRLKN